MSCSSGRKSARPLRAAGRPIVAEVVEGDEARQDLRHLDARELAARCVSGSRASTASDSERFERNGNGCPGSTASGVSTGNTERRKYVRARLLASRRRADFQSWIRIPRAASAGRRSSASSVGRASRAGARTIWPIRASCSRADRPSGLALDRRGRLELLVQARDADHEELVQVRGVDRQELQPLEQRPARVERFVEHPVVERQPGKFAVDVERPVLDVQLGPCVRLVGLGLAHGSRNSIPRAPSPR